MPIGMPGCPDFACSTASIANARIALAMRRSFRSRAVGSGETVAAEEVTLLISAKMVYLGYEDKRSDGHARNQKLYTKLPFVLICSESAAKSPFGCSLVSPP